MPKVKNIQTKVDMDLYDRIRNMARIEGKSINEIVRESLADYLTRHEGQIRDDPLFKVVGSFETKEGDWSERKDWR
jgi:hypothetical protein